jgi:hypothetical protein
MDGEVHTTQDRICCGLSTCANFLNLLCTRQY